MGRLALTRFYALHLLVLPALLFGILWIHLMLMRKHGLSDPIAKKPDPAKQVYFFPTHVFVESIAAIILAAVLIALTKTGPAGLGPEADPTNTAIVPQPEWYFLFLYQLLSYFPGKLEPVPTVLIPGLLVGWLFAIPFIDRSSERRPWKKPVSTGIHL